MYRFFLSCKNWKFSAEQFWYFSYFCSKHWLWVRVRWGGSNEYPQSLFWIKNKNNRYTPVNPSFTFIKVGLRGYTFHGHIFLMYPHFLRHLRSDFFYIGGRHMKLQQYLSSMEIHQFLRHMSRLMRKPTMWFPNSLAQTKLTATEDG